MIKFDIINELMLEKLFENSEKLLFCIDFDTKILEYNQSFEIYCDSFKYLKDLVTYTNQEALMKNISTLGEENPIKKFITNFSFDNKNVEDIPKTYEVIAYYNKDNLYIIANPLPPLSHDDAKLYISLINEYSKMTRENIKMKLKLQNLNHHLKEEIDKGIKELRQKDEIIAKQSRDAAMGEMIDSIAHQWKTPLGGIRMLSQAIKMEYELHSEPQIENIINDSVMIESLVNHLVETLEEFRSFFRPNIPLQKVKIKELIDSVNRLMKNELIEKNINIEFIGDENLETNIIPNQFKHVLINLINNSKDAFVEKSISNRLITYEALNEKEELILRISDNAGGIPESIIENIFTANFTTKEASKGTGIGLYMTKQIVEKINGKIKAYNHNDGVCFEIILPN